MKSGRAGKFPIAVTVVGALALMVLSRCFAPDIVYPLERAWQWASRSAWPCVSGLFRASFVAAENECLRRENAALKMARTELERQEAENDRLRRALEWRSRNPSRWLCAGVLSSGGGATSVRDILRVDKGSLAGVREGAIVVVPEGLVGRVSSVTPRTAEIVLLTDGALKVACEVVAGGRRIRGILSGGGDEQLVLLHLRSAKDLSPQSAVVTSGLGGVFPPGLEVGRLLAVTDGVGGIQGEVKPVVDYSTLEAVFIRCEK